MNNSNEVVQPNKKNYDTLFSISLNCLLLSTIGFYLTMLVLIIISRVLKYNSIISIICLISIILGGMLCSFLRHVGFYNVKRLTKEYPNIVRGVVLNCFYMLLLIIDIVVFLIAGFIVIYLFAIGVISI